MINDAVSSPIIKKFLSLKILVIILKKLFVRLMEDILYEVYPSTSVKSIFQLDNPLSV